jgi:hypothetical protein
MNVQHHLGVARFLATQLDSKFKLFGIRFGLAPIIDAIPGIGDVIDVALSMYLVWIGVQLGLPEDKIGKMIINIAINFVLGIIPIVGEATYIFRKVNLKNLAIIEEYLKIHRVIEGQIVR